MSLIEEIKEAAEAGYEDAVALAKRLENTAEEDVEAVEAKIVELYEEVEAEGEEAYAYIRKEIAELLGEEE